VVLRFMEQKSLREVGIAIGVSEEAARKRVDKALDCLSRFFRRRGFSIPAITATVPLLALGAHAAPPGLASVVTAALGGGAASTAAGSSLTLLNKTLFIMATTKAKVVANASIVALALISTCTVSFLLRHRGGKVNPESLTVRHRCGTRTRVRFMDWL
jgi:hypothetical protein